MYCVAALCRRWAWVPMTVACWLLTVAPAWAQDDAKGPQENSWALAYVLVLLGVGLGLMILCRPGKRSSELP